MREHFETAPQTKVERQSCVEHMDRSARHFVRAWRRGACGARGARARPALLLRISCFTCLGCCDSLLLEPCVWVEVAGPGIEIIIIRDSILFRRVGCVGWRALSGVRVRYDSLNSLYGISRSSFVLQADLPYCAAKNVL